VADEAVALDEDAEEEGVAIAVGEGFDDAEAIAAGGAFLPELGAGAAEESDVAGAEGEGEGVGIEEAEHEDLAGGGVLNDAGEEAAGFGEVEGGFGRVGHGENPFRRVNEVKGGAIEGKRKKPAEWAGS